jgi:hypothetical protein
MMWITGQGNPYALRHQPNCVPSAIIAPAGHWQANSLRIYEKADRLWSVKAEELGEALV